MTKSSLKTKTKAKTKTYEPRATGGVSWSMYLVWLLLLVVVLWRIGAPQPVPSEETLPPTTRIPVQVLVPDDEMALAELHRASPPPAWAEGKGSGSQSTGPAWSEWVAAYYHGAGGAAPFKSLAQELQEAGSRVQVVISPAPRLTLTFEQIHRLVRGRLRTAPDLLLVEPDVYEKLREAGDLLPISGEGNDAVYGIPDTRPAELALRRALANRNRNEEAQSGAAAEAPGKLRPEMLVILRTTAFPQAAREAASRFAAVCARLTEERQQKWDELQARAAEAGAPVPAAHELESLL
ncbi:MAG: hypothetical protein IMX00_07750 [Limnochordales bacterium]|nr:hypothetical protein [Limnochordales bacterium]